MKTVYFVRHGESQANRDGVIAGDGIDSPLTDIGRDQAKSVAEELRSKGIDLVVSSPKSRALDSAKIIANVIGYDSDKIVIIPELTERNVGEATGMKRDEYFEREKNGPPITGADSKQEMYEKVKRGLDKLRALPAENILVVSHNGTGRMVQVIAENRQPEEMSTVKQLQNSSIYRFELV